MLELNNDTKCYLFCALLHEQTAHKWPAMYINMRTMGFRTCNPTGVIVPTVLIPVGVISLLALFFKIPVGLCLYLHFLITPVGLYLFSYNYSLVLLCRGGGGGDYERLQILFCGSVQSH